MPKKSLQLDSIEASRRSEGEFSAKGSFAPRIRPQKTSSEQISSSTFSTNYLLSNTALMGALFILSFAESAEAKKIPKIKKGALAKDILDLIALSSKDDKTIDFLTKSGKKIDARGENGGTPLIISSANNDIKSVEILIKAGASLDKKNNDGMTALILACGRGNIDIAKHLIGGGADINLQDRYGYTALMHSSSQENIRVTKLLIKAGANLDTKNNDGMTALMLASGQGNVQIVNLLIKAGADIELRDEYGQTALTISSARTNSEVIKLLNEAENINKDFTDNTRKHKRIVGILTKAQEDAKFQKAPSANDSPPQILLDEKKLALQQKPINPEADNDNSDFYFVSSLATLAVGVGALFHLKKTPSDLKETHQNLSQILDPINNYLDKLHFFQPHPIEPLKWKIENNNFVLELENQPQNIKDELVRIFTENQNPPICTAQTNGNKTIITFNNQFNKMIIFSNSDSEENRKFESLKTNLETFGTRKEADFEREFGNIFKSAEPLTYNEVKSLNTAIMQGDENSISSIIKLQRLIDFGMVNIADYNDKCRQDIARSIPFQSSKSGIFDIPDFIDGPKVEDWKALRGKDESAEIIAQQLKDSTLKGITIGERILEDGAKYFVRFPEGASTGNCLGCRTINRVAHFYELAIDEKKDVKIVRPLDLDGAKDLLAKMTQPSQEVAVTRFEVLEINIGRPRQ